MSAALAIYLIEILENLNFILSLFWIIALVVFIASLVLLWRSYLDDCPEKSKASLSIINKSWMFILLSLVMCLIPCKQSMYVMLGAKYLSQSELPAKVEKVISLKMDEYIKDITSKSKE